MEALRECPCCGKPGEMKTVYQRFRHGWIGCPACGLYMQWKNDPEAAIRRWNRRTAPLPGQQRLCISCHYSEAAFGKLYCMGQRDKPEVRASDHCNNWRPEEGA